MRRARAERGSVLVWVTVTLATVGALAMLMAREGAFEAELGAASGDGLTARYAAEAAYQHQRWRVLQAGCTTHANLPATPFGKATYSATVTPASGSPVVIEGQGSTGRGASARFQGPSMRLTGTTTSEVIQPGATGKDTYVDGQMKSRNYGGLPSLGVDSGGGQDRFALLEFPISIPPGPIIVDAQLELHLQSTGSSNTQQRFSLHAMKQAWTEGSGNGSGTPDGATYNTSNGTTAWAWPTTYDSTPLASTKVNPTLNGWHRWEVTSAVKGWVSGAVPNRGLVLIGNNQVRDAFFASSENPDPTLRPKLTVSYACECGAGGAPTTTVLQPGPAAGFDTYIGDGSNSSVNFGTDSRMRISEKSSNKDRGLLRFDLTAIPPTATISAATLQLALEGIGSAQPGTVFVHRALRGWTESSATWNEAAAGAPWATAGGDWAPTASASAAVDPSALGPVQWNVKDLVADWVANGGNQGLFLIGTSTLNHADFTSSDGSTAASRPKLTVTWFCPCGTTCTPGPPSGFYRDEFRLATCDPAVDFKGSDGTLDWSPTPWVKVGESSNSCNGNNRLVTDLGSVVLRMGGNGDGMRRPADLSTFPQATLRLQHRRQDLSDASQAVDVEVSTNGSSWTKLGELGAEAGTDATYRDAAFDLTPYRTATTQIRLMGRGLGFSAGTSRYVFVDNVQIDAQSAPPPPPPPGGGNTLVLPAVADTWLDESDRNTANGSALRLHTGKDAGGKERRPLVRFDVSSLPAGATVTSAKLRLYRANWFGAGGSIDVGAHRVTAAWVEASATWNSTGGGSFDSAALHTANVPFSSGWSEWTIPPGLIHEWRDGATPNHGFLLLYAANQKNRWAELASREHATADWRPQLVLEYTTP